MAGELATKYGITGWDRGEAEKAMAVCYEGWKELRGRGHAEQMQIVERISDFIDTHGDSRFSAIDNGILIRDRAGWYRDDSLGRRTYLFTSTGLREAAIGFDFSRVLEVLQAEGVLPGVGASNRQAISVKISGQARKVYPVNGEMLSKNPSVTPGYPNIITGVTVEAF